MQCTSYLLVCLKECLTASLWDEWLRATYITVLFTVSSPIEGKYYLLRKQLTCTKQINSGSGSEWKDHFFRYSSSTGNHVINGLCLSLFLSSSFSFRYVFKQVLDDKSFISQLLWNFWLKSSAWRVCQFFGDAKILFFTDKVAKHQPHVAIILQNLEFHLFWCFPVVDG